jgi:hypothetical protein
MIPGTSALRLVFELWQRYDGLVVLGIVYPVVVIWRYFLKRSYRLNVLIVDP